MNEKNYITNLGLERLCDERDYLLTKLRPETVKVVQWAASLGDRSENADYQYGKKKLREIDKRLRFLAKRIESAVVVDLDNKNEAIIQFGASVTLLDQQGEEKKYTIVGVDEIDLSRGLISWKSPIARAILGKKPGDEFEVLVGEESWQGEVLQVEYRKINIAKWTPL